MKRFSVVAIAVSTLLTVAACTGAEAPDASPPAPVDSLETTTPPGQGPVDNVNWNLGDGEPFGLDPSLTWSGSQNFVGSNLCESLLTVDAEGAVQPQLATEVTNTDDTTLVAKLRSGVTFWDGTDLTAEDVAFSINRARTDPTSQFAGDLASVKDIVATDPNTVTITLKKPDSLIRATLATAASAVYSKSFYEANQDTFGAPGGTLMCTGPYKLQAWNPGKNIIIEANPDWWGAGEGKQLTKQITFSFITDPSAAVAGFKDGELDGAFLLPASSVRPLQNTDTGSVGFGRSSTFLSWVPIINTGGSMSNPKLREALALSQDYQSLVNTLTAGSGSPARALGTPGSWGYEKAAYQAAWDDLPEPAEDLDAARQLVEESGVSNPRLVIAAFSELPDSVNDALVLEAAADSIGFDASVKKVGFDYANTLFSSEKKTDVDIFGTQYLSVVSDPLSIYAQVGLEGGAANWGGYSNPDVTDLLNKALAAYDDAERARYTIQAQKLMTEDYAWIPTVTAPNAFFMSDAITGAVVSGPSHIWGAWAVELGSAE